ncbi:hypothetical protein [Clostridium algidicarnis]|uniref:hypothetical protein n=1 Tax=Clostridium algidicarnis TaxID=37659 RepID=UPI001C0BE49D|nr:hypothetical protein [Clostridium algidicarnis]MBU3205142.1 hypothetical protein [Clostridium algidicarnis]MBU3213295.1 hypothetical protein [Clostridium algidicarnis]MBU3223810.1 hypothetical protein [Clostridium algidicarnis]
MILKEDLPYPLVHYRNLYGNFVGFQENENSEVVLCSCMKKAVENCIKLFLEHPSKALNSPEWLLLKALAMPEGVSKDIIDKKPPVGLGWLNYIKFKDSLCHRCNNKKPTKKYCIPMYGTKFKQTYGWYVNINYLDKGIHPILKDYINECSKEIVNILKPTKEELQKDMDLYKADKEFVMNKRIQNVDTIIENEVREWFNKKCIGEKWDNETKLYNMIKEIYHGSRILRHFRPAYLEGLELDIYIESLNIGIEYQGEQHFKPFKHWGGKEAFKKRQELDKKKKQLCNENNIKLIYVNYNEELNEELIRAKLLEELKI